MRGYAWIYCAHINVCTIAHIRAQYMLVDHALGAQHARICLHSMRGYAQSMRVYICAKYACVYMRKVCVHIYARIVCTLHILCAYMHAYLIYFWRIRTHTWRTDTASMRAYLVCVETLSRTLLKTKINYEYCQALFVKLITNLQRIINSRLCFSQKSSFKRMLTKQSKPTRSFAGTQY